MMSRIVSELFCFFFALFPGSAFSVEEIFTVEVARVLSGLVSEEL